MIQGGDYHICLYFAYIIYDDQYLLHALCYYVICIRLMLIWILDILLDSFDILDVLLVYYIYYLYIRYA